MRGQDHEMILTLACVRIVGIPAGAEAGTSTARNGSDTEAYGFTSTFTTSIRQSSNFSASVRMPNVSNV
ncbi:MAG: hypothetical protein ACI8T1_001165 [Verrucomicrobiales bacterium]|jgi:hypothetical protein